MSKHLSRLRLATAVLPATALFAFSAPASAQSQLNEGTCAVINGDSNASDSNTGIGDGSCVSVTGDSDEKFAGMWFADTDVYKTLEAIAWETGRTRGSSEFFLDTAALIEKAQDADGYVNSYYQVDHRDAMIAVQQIGDDLTRCRIQDHRSDDKSLETQPGAKDIAVFHPKGVEIDAIAQHGDFFRRRSQLGQPVLERLANGDNGAGAFGRLQDQASRARVFRDQVDVGAARGDGQRQAEFPRQPCGRDAVGRGRYFRKRRSGCSLPRGCASR